MGRPRAIMGATLSLLLLLVVAFAVTAILIWSSRRVVHYQGAAR